MAPRDEEPHNPFEAFSRFVNSQASSLFNGMEHRRSRGDDRRRPQPSQQVPQASPIAPDSKWWDEVIACSRLQHPFKSNEGLLESAAQLPDAREEQLERAYMSFADPTAYIAMEGHPYSKMMQKGLARFLGYQDTSYVSPWLLFSPYSPIRLEKCPDMQKVQWRLAFQDLMRLENGEPMTDVLEQQATEWKTPVEWAGRMASKFYEWHLVNHTMPEEAHRLRQAIRRQRVNQPFQNRERMNLALSEEVASQENVTVPWEVIRKENAPVAWDNHDEWEDDSPKHHEREEFQNRGIEARTYQGPSTELDFISAITAAFTKNARQMSEDLFNEARPRIADGIRAAETALSQARAQFEAGGADAHSRVEIAESLPTENGSTATKRTINVTYIDGHRHVTETVIKEKDGVEVDRQTREYTTEQSDAAARRNKPTTTFFLGLPDRPFDFERREQATRDASVQTTEQEKPQEPTQNAPEEKRSKSRSWFWSD